MKPRRIVILPFVTEDQQLQYLVESIQDLLIAALSRSQNYQVISKASTRIAGVTNAIETVGRQLNAQHIISGVLIEQEGILAFIKYHLLDKGRTEQKSIALSKKDLFSLGEKILEAVTDLLQISNGETRSREVEKLQHPETYQKFLLGNFHFNRWTNEDVTKAIALYEKVIAVEPHFIPAYLKLAKSYIFQAGRGYMLPKEVYPKARMAIETGLKINPNSGEAIIDKNLIDFFYDLNWKSIYDSVEKGLANYVDASEAYQQLSFFWYGLKEYDAALDALYSALEYDPLSTGILNMIGDVQLSAQRYDEAEKTFQSILKLIPNDVPSLENLLYIASLQGRLRKAEGYINKLNRLLSSDEQYLPRLGYAYAKFGFNNKVAEFKRYYERMRIKNTTRLFYNPQANIYAGLRDWNKTLELIEKGWKARTGILYILTDPQLEPIRKTPRYQALVKQIRYPKLKDNINYITLETDIKETVRVNLNALLYAEGEDNYTRLHFYQNFRKETKLIRATIKKIALQLPSDQFMRIQKSFILNLNQPFKVIGNVRNRTVYSQKYDYELPVSRSIQDTALDRLRSKALML